MTCPGQPSGCRVMGMIACPACKRPNSPQRTTCLYCGSTLPGGGVAPSARPVLPANLDELVAAALRKGEIGKLKQAIEESQAEQALAPEGEAPPPEPPRSPEPPPVRPASRPPEPRRVERPPESRSPILAISPVEVSVPARPAPAAPEPAPVAPDPASLLRQLSEQAAALELAWRQGQTLTAGLDAVAALLAQLQALAPRSPPPAVVLPPIRQEWSLVLESPAEASLAAELAEALELDLATARMLSLGRAVRVGRRANQREELERYVERLREKMQIQATIVGREDLRRVAMPRFILRLGTQRWTLGEGALWELDPERIAALTGEDAPPAQPRCVVVGEVVTRRYRASAGGRGARRELKPELVAERRVGVVDLHLPGEFYRLVEGASDPSPEEPPGPALPRFRAFTEALSGRFPGAHIEARRVCRPMEAPFLREGAEHNEGVEVSGWPQFEEHTRLCRLHLLALASG